MCVWDSPAFFQAVEQLDKNSDFQLPQIPAPWGGEGTSERPGQALRTGLFAWDDETHD